MLFPVVSVDDDDILSETYV